MSAILEIVGMIFAVLLGLAVWAYVFAGYGIFFSFSKPFKSFIRG